LELFRLETETMSNEGISPHSFKDGYEKHYKRSDFFSSEKRQDIRNRNNHLALKEGKERK